MSQQQQQQTKKLSICVIFITLALMITLLCCSFNDHLVEAVPLPARLNPGLSPSTISKAAYELRKFPGLQGCIKFAIKLAHESIKLDSTLSDQVDLSLDTKDIVRLVNPALNDLMKILQNLSFNLRDSIAKHTKECQAKFGWEYIIGNPSLFAEFSAQDTLEESRYSYTGDQLAQMRSLEDIIIH